MTNTSEMTRNELLIELYKRDLKTAIDEDDFMGVEIISRHIARVKNV